VEVVAFRGDRGSLQSLASSIVATKAINQQAVELVSRGAPGLDVDDCADKICECQLRPTSSGKADGRIARRYVRVRVAGSTKNRQACDVEP